MVWLYGGFILFVLIMMVADLKYVGRHKEGVTTGTALAWTGLCVLLALGFVPVVYYLYENHVLGLNLQGPAGPDGKPTSLGGVTAATLFLQGWIIEYALSIDNIFVFAVIFKHFGVPDKHQHRVLAWGIIAALLLRGVMIGVGVTLLTMFHWLLYVAGLFLIYTAWGMVRGDDEAFDPNKSLAVRIARKFFPVSSEFHGDRFFVREKHGQGMRWAATPMLLVLVVLNVVDIVFALDSIPAILGVTTEMFIVFTSNVFAILGLRSLYFVLAGMMHKFEYLGVSLAVILAFVGVKMIIHDPVSAIGFPGVPISPLVSLGIIIGVLATGVVLSIRLAGKAEPAAAGGGAVDTGDKSGGGNP